MKTQHLQSLQHRNAVEITKLHEKIKHTRAHASSLYKAAQHEIKKAQKLTATIKKLAANQVAIKKDIKGPPKQKRTKNTTAQPSFNLPQPVQQATL